MKPGRSLAAALAALAALLVACGGGPGPAAPNATDEGPVTTSGAASGGDGLVAAPDFTLTLEPDGGEFVLSEAAKPVYLVFWAEW